MIIKPRDYQLEALDKIRGLFVAGRRRIILEAPTGAGKTVVACEVIRGARSKNKRVMFLAHQTELIEQCSKKLDDYSTPHGVIQGDHWRTDYSHPVQVASVKTLANRRGIPAPDIIIIDECHHATSPTYIACIERFPQSLILGLSATPYRLDGKGLGHIFEEVIRLITTAELIQRGYLVEPIVYAPDDLNLSGVKTQGGDWKRDQLSAICDRRELVGNIVQHWEEHAAGRPTVAFAVNVDHSRHIVERFVERGIRAVHVDGKTSKSEREDAFGGMSDGTFQILCNVGIATEGVDIPCLSCGIMARPTKSRSLWRQMVGRVLRLYKGKNDAILLDHANLTTTHGFITDLDDYTLDGIPKRTSSGGESAPGVRVCPECWAANPSGSPNCDYCDYEFPVQAVIPEETKGKLKRVTRGPYIPDASEQKKFNSWVSIVNTCRNKGYKPGWCYKQYDIRFKEAVPPKFLHEYPVDIVPEVA